MNSEITLYNYFRSSASFRVRIGLYFKEIPFTYRAVHLVKDGGEQFKSSFTDLNPMAEVPCLVHGGRAISQSMAILQYLDEVFPAVKLFSDDPFKKAQIIQFCEVINAGIHPVQNLKVLTKLGEMFGADTNQKQEWARYWIHRGFLSVEQMLEKSSAEFSIGPTLTAADLYLVPQVFNAKRYGVEMGEFPIINRITEHCLKLEAFAKARPEVQPDFVP